MYGHIQWYRVDLISVIKVRNNVQFYSQTRGFKLFNLHKVRFFKIFLNTNYLKQMEFGQLITNSKEFPFSGFITRHEESPEALDWHYIFMSIY